MWSGTDREVWSEIGRYVERKRETHTQRWSGDRQGSRGGLGRDSGVSKNTVESRERRGGLGRNSGFWEKQGGLRKDYQ